MHKKAHIKTKSIIYSIHSVLGILCSLVLISCSLIDSKTLTTPVEKIVPLSAPSYRYVNGQLLLRVYLDNKEYWGVLDSGSTENLLVDITGSESKNLSTLQGQESVLMEFQPWGMKTSPEYRMILGQPFFRSFCIILDMGIPTLIQINHKKPCFPFLEGGSLPRFSVNYLSGQYIIPARVEEFRFDIALDTGSGISSIPSDILGVYGEKTSYSKKVLYAMGESREIPLYRMKNPIYLIQKQSEISTELHSVFSEEEVWNQLESLYPTLGMDFFSKFRVYIDFGSKIIGLDPNGNER